jgi:hypothetical protein
MQEIDSRRAARILLLTAILAILAGFKLAYLPRSGQFGFDGSFYVNVARNVQEGAGLRTSISMYHYGELELPTRSRLIYPLWPLLLGYVARIVGLYNAVNFLPPLLYLCDLLMLYAIVNRMAKTQWIVTPGHLFVLLIGMNGNFFGATSYPYTEALGFFFALASLLVLDAAFTRSGWYAPLAALLAGAALLTRSQLVIVGAALLITVAWIAICSRRRIAFAAAAFAVYSAFVAFYYFGITRLEGSPNVVIAPPFRMWNPTSGADAFLRERLQGIAASLSPTGGYSFFASFGPVFLLPLVALPVAAVRWWRQRTFCIRPESALIAACALVGVATFASLNLFHHIADFFIPWVFGFRHGLPMLFGIAAAAVYLIGAGRVTRVIALVCIVASIVLSGVRLVDRVTTSRPVSPTPSEWRLFAWLEAQRPRPTIITDRAQHISVYTHANIHWTECRTPPETTRAMLAKLPVDYVIVYASGRGCRFIDGLQDALEIRRSFDAGGEPIIVLGRRRVK